jgi:hypothetical protein
MMGGSSWGIQALRILCKKCAKKEKGRKSRCVEFSCRVAMPMIKAGGRVMTHPCKTMCNIHSLCNSTYKEISISFSFNLMKHPHVDDGWQLRMRTQLLYIEDIINRNMRS